jgi:hypothetical protein
MLNLTAEGMAEARKEAELFGIAMSRADAKKMENINDSVTRVKAAIQGAAITLVKQFAPTLESVGNKLAEWSKSGKLSEWAKSLGQFLLDVIPRGVILTITAVGKLVNAMRGWEMLVTEVKIQWLNILSVIQQVVIKASKYASLLSVASPILSAGLLEAGKDSLEVQKNILKQIQDERDKAEQKQNQNIKNAQEEQNSIEQIKKNIDSFVKSIEKGSGAVETQTEKVNKLAGAYEKAATSAQKLGNVGGGKIETGEVAAQNRKMYEEWARTQGK